MTVRRARTTRVTGTAETIDVGPIRLGDGTRYLPDLAVDTPDGPGLALYARPARFDEDDDRPPVARRRRVVVTFPDRPGRGYLPSELRTATR